MVILIDFDGTCVTHEFPRIGKSIGAVPVLKELVACGHQLILFTMRSDMEDVKTSDPSIYGCSGNYLTDAVNWFKDNDIPLYGVNINPTQQEWTRSPKAYGQLIIDDAALGVPLVFGEHRPYVDWKEVRKWLTKNGLLRK